MADFQRSYDFRPEAYADLLSKITSLLVVTCVAYTTASHWAIVNGTVTTTIVLFAFTYYIAPYRPTLSLKHWRIFADVLGWNTVAQIAQTLTWQLDAILLGRALPTDLFGRYSISRNLNDLPQQAISLPLTRPMFMSFSNAETDLRRCDLWLKFSNTTLYIVGPILITMAILSDATVQILLGSQWHGVGVFLFGLTLASLPTLPGLPLNQLAISMHKSHIVAIRAIMQMVVLVPLMIVGLWYSGVIGVIAAKGCMAITMAVVSMMMVRNLIGLSIGMQLWCLLRTFAGLLLMAAVLSLLQPLIIGPLDGTSRLVLAVQAFAVFCLAAACYVAFTCILWILQGRPQAIEATIVKMVQAIRNKIRSGMQA